MDKPHKWNVENWDISTWHKKQLPGNNAARFSSEADYAAISTTLSATFFMI